MSGSFVYSVICAASQLSVSACLVYTSAISLSIAYFKIFIFYSFSIFTICKSCFYLLFMLRIIRICFQDSTFSLAKKDPGYKTSQYLTDILILPKQDRVTVATPCRCFISEVYFDSYPFFPDTYIISKVGKLFYQII